MKSLETSSPCSPSLPLPPPGLILKRIGMMNQGGEKGAWGASDGVCGA